MYACQWQHRVGHGLNSSMDWIGFSKMDPCPTLWQQMHVLVTIGGQLYVAYLNCITA